MQRIIIVYNPRSTRAERVTDEVLKRARELNGVMVGRFLVEKAPIVENAKRLARMLTDGDIIVTAGGDGTTEVGVNAICMAGKAVRMGVLPYGNFNDVARMFGLKKLDEVLTARTEKVYPMMMSVNGRIYQYGLGYFTVGMFAQSTEIFERKNVRKKLRTQSGRLVYSIWQLRKWYFQNREKAILPEFVLNGKKMKGVTDYLAVNGQTAARVMKGGEYYLRKNEFLSATGELKSFWKLMNFMVKSMTSGVPGKVAKKDVLKFVEPATIVVQSEGEYEKIVNVKEMEFCKGDKVINMLYL